MAQILQVNAQLHISTFYLKLHRQLFMNLLKFKSLPGMKSQCHKDPVPCVESNSNPLATLKNRRHGCTRGNTDISMRASDALENFAESHTKTIIHKSENDGQ